MHFFWAVHAAVSFHFQIKYLYSYIMVYIAFPEKKNRTLIVQLRMRNLIRDLHSTLESLLGQTREIEHCISMWSSRENVEKTMIFKSEEDETIEYVI